MKMKVTKARRTGETQMQTSEYVPRGPVKITKPSPPKPYRDYCANRVGVPEKDRVVGCMYDADSGVMLYLASDEERAAHPARQPYERMIGGLKQRVVVW